MLYSPQHHSVQVMSLLDTLKYDSIQALNETSKVSFGREANHPIHPERKMEETITFSW